MSLLPRTASFWKHDRRTVVRSLVPLAGLCELPSLWPTAMGSYDPHWPPALLCSFSRKLHLHPAIGRDAAATAMSRKFRSFKCPSATLRR